MTIYHPWFCGFLRSIKKQNSPLARDNMIQYGADLMQNALDLGWGTAKGSYKVLLSSIESTDLTWEDLPQIQDLRHQYAQRSIVRASNNLNPTPTANSQLNVRPGRRLLCSRFQSGACTFESDHSADRVRYRHICAFCFHQLGKTFPHRESECQNKQRRGRGNGQVGQSQ